MSHCLSNMLISQPMSHQTSLLSPNLTPSRSWPKMRVVKAMADEGRDNLDYLQRQQQPKKRSAPVVAPIGLWDRFPTARTVQQMMETMERVMEDPFAPLPRTTDNIGYSRGRTPWEIKEGETEYKMRFDMPGMTKEDVKIWVEENMLVVKAEKLPKKKTEDENGEEWSYKSYGRYSSRIALPENVEFEKIKAEVKDGVLYITIPKATTTPKIFDVNVQ